MKKLLQIFVSVLLLCSNAVKLHAVQAGDTFRQGNFEFVVNNNYLNPEDLKYVYLSKYYPDEPASELYDVEIPGTVEYEGKTFIVGGISNAFEECQQVRSVKIPDGVAWLGYSFHKCANLQEVIMSNSVKSIQGTFNECSNLSRINLSENLEDLGHGSFSQCISLTSITIPSSVKHIGQWAFENCGGLTEITIPNSVTQIGDAAFKECSNLRKVVFEDGEEPLEVGSLLFGVWDQTYRCYDNKVSQVYLGRNLTGAYPFRSGDVEDLSKTEHIYSQVSHLTIGNTVTEIRDQEFIGASVSYVDFGNSVTKIGDYAFCGCWLNKGINIPNSVTTIGNGAFKNTCPIGLSLGESVVTIGDEAFAVSKDYYTDGNYTYDEDGEIESLRVPHLVIPNSVKQIGKNAFEGYWPLESLTIGSSVSEIGENAFFTEVKEVIFADSHEELDITNQRLMSVEKLYLGRSLLCNTPWGSSLKEATIGNSVTSIGATTFANCSGLTDIQIPNSVETIGDRAFASCGGLTSLSIPESVKNIGAGAFDSCNKIDEVSTPSLSAWLDIEFGNEYANPLKYASKFIADGVTVRRMTIPEGTERINAYAFANFESLVSVNFPAGVKSVGDKAFKGATGLQRFTFNNQVDYLGIGYDSENALLPTGNSGKIYINQDPYVQEEYMVWPKELNYIPAYAFYANMDIYDLVVPSNLVSIGEYAFAGSTLSRINTTNREAFDDFASALPIAITQIPEACFRGTLLREITIPARVKYLAPDCFVECTSLRKMVYEGTPECIDGNAFNYFVPSITIPDVNAWAGVIMGLVATFYPEGEIITNGTKIENLVVEPETDYVDWCTFSGAPVKKVRVKAALIGTGAFFLSPMESLCIETEEIETQAFKACDKLTEVYSLTAVPPTAGDDVFSKYDGVTLYVPRGARAAYENTETCWCQFLDIVETDFEDIDELFKANYAVNTGVDPILSTDDDVKVYNLNGVYLGDSTENLPRGIYIVRQGSSVKKISI